MQSSGDSFGGKSPERSPEVTEVNYSDSTGRSGSVMDTTFVPSDNSPAIYKVRFERPSELNIIYRDVILSGALLDQVQDAFCRYVTNHIEPIGWHAIWRPTHLKAKCEFEVEVVDVAHQALETDVVVLGLLAPEQEQLTIEEYDEIQDLLRMKITQAPLIELYVISENDFDEQFFETAQVIEHVRFFYTNLWRPWDEIQMNTPVGNEVFVDTRLQTRLDFWNDIKDNLIPDETVQLVRRLLQEAWTVKRKIDSLVQGSVEDSVFDVDKKFIDEADLFTGLMLKLQLEDIEREMKLLEDPQMRAVVSKMERNYNNIIKYS